MVSFKSWVNPYLRDGLSTEMFKIFLPLDKLLVEWYLPEYIVPCINIGGVDIMIWGCSLGIQLGAVGQLKGPLHAAVYKHIWSCSGAKWRAHQ